MGFVYGDKVQVVATGERAKINRVFAETYQVEYTTGELQEMRPDELEPAPDAEIARLREQVDTLTRERDAAREALKPFAAAWEAWLRLLETEDEAEFGMHLFYEDIPQLDGHPFEDAYRVVKQADAANVLADGGE